MGVTRAEDSVEIEAPIDHVYAVLTDHERIPEWQGPVDRVNIRKRDADGRGTEVEFFIDIKVKKLRYVNEFTHNAPTRLSFSAIDGDLKKSEGEYEFTDLGDGRTLCVHRLDVDPGRFIPGPIKKMLTDQMLRDVLRDLKLRAEELA